MANIINFYILYLKPFLLAFWPSFLAVILALVIDRTRLPRLTVYAEKDKIINDYPKMDGRWRFTRFIVLNKKMPFILRWLPRQIAQNCSATLEFFDLTGKSLFKMRGRWANTTEIVHVAEDSRIERILFPDPISIFPGETEQLDCIVQKENETKAYGWNNESYHNRWRTPRHELVDGDYKVKVKVITQNGTSFAKVFNLNVNKDFELTSLRTESKFNFNRNKVCARKCQVR